MGDEQSNSLKLSLVVKGPSFKCVKTKVMAGLFNDALQPSRAPCYPR